MEIYVVQPGDDIQTIADKYKITVTKLVQDNGIEDLEHLIPGQTLVIVYPKQAHIVKEGDTLSSIANDYGITLMQLIRNNPILWKREYIYPGDTLVISYDTKGNINTHGICYPFIDQKILLNTLPYLTYLSIFNYTATGEGDFITYYDETEIIELAKAYGVVPLMLSTTSTPLGTPNEQAAYNILVNEVSQENYINETLNILKTKGYHGINLVINFINEANQLLYHNFISSFSERLKEEGYVMLLTINIEIKNVNNEVSFQKIDYSPFYPHVVDIIFLRFIWGTNYEPPSPVISISNIELFTEYAITMVSPEKIILGIPVISYDWELPFIPGKSFANSLSIDATLRLAHAVNATIEFDEISLTPFFNYNLRDNEHVVWSLDARTLDSFLNLITKYSLSGTLIWNIMVYYTQLWLIINSQYEIVKLL